MIPDLCLQGLGDAGVAILCGGQLGVLACTTSKRSAAPWMHGPNHQAHVPLSPQGEVPGQARTWKCLQHLWGPGPQLQTPHLPHTCCPPHPPSPQPQAAVWWRLLGMDGAAFWVMKYSQVSDSLRNDGDQSIPFQGVIFFPFTASVSC